MEDSLSNLTNDSVNSSYKNPRLLGVRIPERIGQGCAKEDIVVNQSPESPMPNGVPSYSVEIQNLCSTGCSIAQVHVTCGWFSSAVEIDPKLFKRLSYNDCLVNNGRPIKAGGSVSFVYAQTYKYPIAVSSVKCV
ncbi:hypothetical protein SUGI_1007740 [Cryptomeria japonica]|uniref:protein TAPETUM DETERMINANT 1-like n=1 Tax=Cryptomeria japonica TaxID=3369 RepID=UPI00241474C2|nr:protein TAPETUM DETERMINANT 1-like [Cryptomeria japonica]GLJ47717.1 hypothetical protein SUGI_1007740 [Cryptomeria japonica]